MNIGGLGLVIVAAGSSTRMQGVDKVWAGLGNRPVLWHSLHALAPSAVETVLVVREGEVDRARAVIDGEMGQVRVVPGGRERRESVERGLRMLDQGIRVAAVHDAARPFAGPNLLQSGLEALQGHGGAIPVIPLYDTVKRVDASGAVIETVDRASLRLVQTPQLFDAMALRRAHGVWSEAAGLATDDASMLEAAGFEVASFPGAPENFKITTAFDLRLAQLLIESVSQTSCE